MACEAAMTFRDEERRLLLAVKGVGPTVIRRLEEMGLHDLKSLSRVTTDTVLSHVSAALGASCWKNSPQARAAINAAIAAAQAYSED